MVTVWEKAHVPGNEARDYQERGAKHKARCPSVGQEPIFLGPQASVPEASPFTGIQP